MKKHFKYLVLAVIAFAAAACQQSDIDDLERDIDQLQQRLKALETQVEVLNSNTEALQKLLSGATVNSVTESGGVYTVTLSNGEVLTLTQGSEGGYYTPVVSVDSEGYWTVSTDGENFTRISDRDGNPVRAVAANGTPGEQGAAGVTPKFKVDTNGYWLVSYDDGATYTQVLDSDGQPVSATSGSVQDKFFADVQVSGDLLVVQLLSGGTYKIPIVAGFKCIISNTEEVVLFAQNETKTFDVDMVGVTGTVITVPEGWTAALTAKADAAENTPGYTLTVTAPQETGTRATADSRIDLSILAVADNGLSTIAKMCVATNDIVLHTPTVSSVTVDSTRSTEASLTFSVVTDDATGWKYLCLPSTDAAPDAATVFETGEEGGTGAVTAGGLNQWTYYTIYVVAYYDSTVGTVLGSTEARTARGNVDYYEEGVTLGGVTYSKETANAKLITEPTAISGPGVYFLDPAAADATISLGKCTATELVLIGRHSLTRVKVTVTTGPLSLGTGTGLILKNVELDAGAYTNYLLNFASGTVTSENLIFEDCKIIAPADKQFSNFNNAAGTVDNISIESSIVELKATGNGKAMRVINLANGYIGKSMNFNNSVFYTNGYVTHGCLLHVNTDTDTQFMPDVTVSVKNCSLINYIGYPNGYFNLSKVKSVDFTNNILWGQPYTQLSYTFKFLVADPGTTLNYTNNRAYGLIADNSGCWKYFQTGSLYQSDNTGSYTKESDDPFLVMDFSTDTFTPVDTAYGANL